MGLYIYFGAPGSGKTTYLAKLARQYNKKGYKVYSNVEILGTYQIDVLEDVGKNDISNGVLLIDEAGIEYNNRLIYSKKGAQTPMNNDAIYFYKKYRHYGIKDVIIVSQDYEDMDITLRRLSVGLYLVKPTIIPKLSRIKPIYKKCGIDEMTHQPVSMYAFKPFTFIFIWLPRYYKDFDSFEHKELPVKEFKYLERIPKSTILKRLREKLPKLTNVSALGIDNKK